MPVEQRPSAASSSSCSPVDEGVVSPSGDQPASNKTPTTATSSSGGGVVSSPSSSGADEHSGTTKKRSEEEEESIRNYRRVLGSRALAAGGHLSRTGGGSSVLRPGSSGSSGVSIFRPAAQHVAVSSPRYLVVGDGLMAPFMALCLRVHGLSCDLAYHPSRNPVDRGTILLPPSATQLLGDVLGVSVPSGSVIGRMLAFDHVGNDMCDLDLNEFREQGESPTFFCCDREKVEAALLSLCEVGAHRCHVLSNVQLDRGGLEALGRPGSGSAGGGGVRVRFAGSGIEEDYLGVITTARNQQLVPELTLTQEELQQHAENAELHRETLSQAPRWLELCVPPLPPLKAFEKRFTPGSQEVVEIITPRAAKLTIRPTMLATKLFYHVTLTIPDSTADPTLKSTSTKVFWDDVASHWTAGIPGYVSHTLFRPLLTHLQQHFTKSRALVYRTPSFVMPNWSEGEGRIVKVAHAAHSTAFDALDVGDMQGMTDCFMLARAIAEGHDVEGFLKERRLQVMEEMEHHSRLLSYGLRERGQLGFMTSRFGMKLMGRYKKSWRQILKNYVSVIVKKK